MEEIEKYYLEHWKSVYYFLLSKTHNEEVAEELTQETFFQAMKSYHKYRGDAKPLTWLCQIAKHMYYQYLSKKDKISHISLEDITIESDDVSIQVLERFDKLELYKKINRLDSEKKEVVYLRLSGDLSFAEIGGIMNKSENWARVTFYRAKKTLMEGEGK